MKHTDFHFTQPRHSSVNGTPDCFSTDSCLTNIMVKIAIKAKGHNGLSVEFPFSPRWQDFNLPFLITPFNLILILKYCHNKVSTTGWKTKPVLREEFVLGGHWRCHPQSAGWPPTKRLNSARLSACQAKGAAARPNQQALIQPATGSPCTPSSSRPSLWLQLPSPMHAHSHSKALITRDPPKANLPSFFLSFFFIKDMCSRGGCQYSDDK